MKLWICFRKSYNCDYQGRMCKIVPQSIFVCLEFENNVLVYTEALKRICIKSPSAKSLYMGFGMSINGYCREPIGCGLKIFAICREPKCRLLSHYSHVLRGAYIISFGLKRVTSCGEPIHQLSCGGPINQLWPLLNHFLCRT